MLQANNIQKNIQIQLSDTRFKQKQIKQDQNIKNQPINQNDSNPQRLKNTSRNISIGLIISISALMFGYSLKQITSVPIATLVKQYQISIDKFAAQSILIGILPLGAIIGVLITKVLMTRFRRLAGIYVFTFVNVGAIVLVNINIFGVLVAGRFIQGICIGYYTKFAPIYLKQIAPKELRKMLGLFFSFGKIVGVLIVIIIELAIEQHHFQNEYRVILSMTAVFSVLQAILIFFFGSDTPAEMIEKGKESRAMEIIESFYKQQHVKQVFNEYKKEFQMQAMKDKQVLSQNQNTRKKIGHQINFQLSSTQQHLGFPQSEPNMINFIKFSAHKQLEVQKIDSKSNQNKDQLTFQQKKNYAYCLGIHLCVIRHWTGGNAIISQGGLFINNIDKNVGHWTSIIINSIQFIFVVLGLVVIQKYLGKRPLFLFSVIILSLLNIALAISMIYTNLIVAEFIMCIYMAVYGGSFISPIWSYPSQIIPASQALLPNIVHWLALAFSTLIPPLITGAMPNNNAYPVFIFFGLYGFASFIHIFRYLRQSDGKSYNQIIKSFK